MTTLLSIQCAPVPRTIVHGQKTVETGIWKTPVDAGEVLIGTLGLEGDIQVDRVNHGGTDKAVYVYSQDNLDWWSGELGRVVPAGCLGENLTVSGLSDDEVCIGDCYRLGEGLFQVTQPRVPCFKLGVRMEDPGFVRRFHHSGRTGFYWRVLAPGQVRVGDAVELVSRGEGALTVAYAMQAVIPGPDRDRVRQTLLANPALSAAWREDFQGS